MRPLSRPHFRLHFLLNRRRYHQPSYQLSGYHALITGASRGIGLTTAHLLASLGCTLTLISRSSPALSSALSSLPNPDLHTTIPGDISQRTFWSSLHEKLPKTQRLDILINAAGITHQSLFVRTSEDVIDDVVRTNLVGTMLAAKWAGKRMVRQGRKHERDQDKVSSAVGKGVIINIASLLGVQGGYGSAVYAASKAGVVGFTRSLAAEMGLSGVRVNAVLPGYVNTDMTDAMTAEAREQAVSRIPLKRFGETGEVAEAVLFLIMNGYAHNCVLNLDGGLSATK
ncbi:Short chain dehydrogenase-like protein 12 [Elsinoe fawcettii]|nr:Short chain dehydrogenase-like protein 12 [Elsinoe fawcettii]